MPHLRHSQRYSVYFYMWPTKSLRPHNWEAETRGWFISWWLTVSALMIISYNIQKNVNKFSKLKKDPCQHFLISLSDRFISDLSVAMQAKTWPALTLCVSHPPSHFLSFMENQTSTVLHHRAGSDLSSLPITIHRPASVTQDSFTLFLINVFCFVFLNQSSSREFTTSNKVETLLLNPGERSL